MDRKVGLVAVILALQAEWVVAAGTEAVMAKVAMAKGEVVAVTEAVMAKVAKAKGEVAAVMATAVGRIVCTSCRSFGRILKNQSHNCDRSHRLPRKGCRHMRRHLR